MLLTLVVYGGWGAKVILFFKMEFSFKGEVFKAELPPKQSDSTAFSKAGVHVFTAFFGRVFKGEFLVLLFFFLG